MRRSLFRFPLRIPLRASCLCWCRSLACCSKAANCIAAGSPPGPTAAKAACSALAGAAAAAIAPAPAGAPAPPAAEPAAAMGENARGRAGRATQTQPRAGKLLHRIYVCSWSSARRPIPTSYMCKTQTPYFICLALVRCMSCAWCYLCRTYPTETPTGPPPTCKNCIVGHRACANAVLCCAVQAPAAKGRKTTVYVHRD